MKSEYSKKQKQVILYSNYSERDREYINIEEEKLLNKKDEKHSNIVCELNVGEHLIRIIGLGNGEGAYDYEVIQEYPYLYVIKITYMTGFASDKPTYICTSVSKASIYCGHVVLIKEDGSKVRARAIGWTAG